MDQAVAPALQSVRDRVLSEAGGEQLRTFRHAFLFLKDEFDATLTAHMAVNVALNLLRLYARPRRINSRRASPS